MVGAGAGGGGDAGLDEHAVARDGGGESPSRRSRTAPSRSGSTQAKQMPIRQPDGISTPASSPASSSGVRRRPRRPCRLGEGDGAALAGDEVVGRKRSVQQGQAAPAVVHGLDGVEQPAGPAGPGTRARPGPGPGRPGRPTSRTPVGVVAVCQLDQPEPARAARPGDDAQARRDDHEHVVAAVCEECTTTGVGTGITPRSMPHHRRDAAAGGENRTFAGAGAAARSRRPHGRGAPRATPGALPRWVLTIPPGTALTVTVMQPSGDGGGDE